MTPAHKDQTAALVDEIDGGGQQEEGSIVKPIVKVQDALSDLRSFEQMKGKLLSKSDYQVIQGKNFIKKSGWRKLALVCNISDEIMEKSKETRGDGSFVWTFRVRSKAPNGRHTEAVAACDSKERRFAHPEHDVLATAHTRAKSRAISDLIGAGEVSAEEMYYDDSLDEEDAGHGEMGDQKLEQSTMTSLGIQSAKKLSPESTQRFEFMLNGREIPVGEEEGPFARFFLNKICKGIMASHPASSFRFERDSSNKLIAVVWKNLDDEKAKKEVSDTLAWTLKKIVDLRTHPASNS